MKIFIKAILTVVAASAIVIQGRNVANIAIVELLSRQAQCHSRIARACPMIVNNRRLSVDQIEGHGWEVPMPTAAACD